MPIKIVERKGVVKIASIAKLVKEVRRLPLGTTQKFSLLLSPVPKTLARMLCEDRNVFSRQHPEARVTYSYLQPLLRKSIPKLVKTKTVQAERFICVRVRYQSVINNPSEFTCEAEVSIQFTAWDKQGNFKLAWGEHLDYND